jgi:hypothetical protein
MYSWLGIVAPVEGPKIGVQCTSVVNWVSGIKGCQTNPVCCTHNDLYVLPSYFWCI